MKKTKLLVALWISASMGFAQQLNFSNVINVVGSGAPGYSGDGGQALSATLFAPGAVAFDAAGNMYIADQGNYVIRKVNAAGIITTVAGSGLPGPSKTGTTSAASSFNFGAIFSLCFDAAGNLYAADNTSQIVWEIALDGSGAISPQSIVSDFAGVGPSVNFLGDGGPANAASVSPGAIIMDKSNNMYIGDNENHLIRKVNGATGIISSITGFLGFGNTGGHTGDGAAVSSAFVSGALGFAFDSNGNLYFTDSGNSRIREIKVNSAGTIDGTSIITAFAGAANTGNTNAGYVDGPASTAKFSNPWGLAIDAYNNVYIADQSNGYIRMVNASSLVVSTIAGQGINPGINNYDGTGIAPLSAHIDPQSLAMNGCNLYATDVNDTYHGNVIAKLTNNATLTAAITASPSVCAGNFINAAVTLGGNTTPNNYYIEVDEVSDANGYNPTLVWNNWFSGAPANPLKIPGSNTLTCGHYYKIGLVVQNTNACIPWAPSSGTIVYVNCNPAPVIVGKTNICLGQSTNLCENSYPTPANNVNWVETFTNGNDPLQISSTSCATNLSPTTNAYYAVTVTSTLTGCSGIASTTVTVQNIAPNFALTPHLPAAPNNHFYTIEASGYTQSTDPTFKLKWGVMEVAVGSSAPYVAIAPGTSEVDDCPSWDNISGFGPVYFDGYVTNMNAPYNSYGPGPNYVLNTTSTTAGQFRANHEYCVTLTTSSGTCPAKSYSVTTIQSCSGCRTEGIEEEGTSSQINIYPNPSNGNFTVETPETGDQLLQVFDLTGRLVISQTINSTATIDGSNLVDGVYNVKISNNNNVTNKRIVITR